MIIIISVRPSQMSLSSEKVVTFLDVVDVQLSLSVVQSVLEDAMMNCVN